MEESKSKESLSCAGCLNVIGNDDYVSALNQDWHKDCFRCSVCDALLSTWYFERGGLLFCQADYWARYGESCQQCAQVMTGPVMAAGEHRFHPECFACCACGAHIEDGESYALVDRSSLYCGACYTCGGVQARSCAHEIRVVDVPPAAVRLAHNDKGQLAVVEIDSSCGLLTLHIGDRILEINGTPVKNRPLDEIERVISRPDAIIQLTIERNPETISSNSPQSIKQVQMCNIHQELDTDKTKHDKSVETKPQREGKELDGRKERLFKRKGEDGGKTRVMRRRQTPTSPLLGDKERSSSMSKLLDVTDGEEPCGVLCDLSRARSFRADPANSGNKVFLACDLLQGELLGSGFFGEVYKVTHRETNEVMVLKQLYRVDEDAEKNFLKEVAVLRSLKHPNVLRFMGVLYKDKRLHLITEYVAGGTLHQLIQDTTVPLSWVNRAKLARDVAAGVGYLHRMNVIHRDLNSHNCLVREDKTVIVADFGLARIVQRTASSTLERPRNNHSTLRRKRYTVVGNPYWMAPEMMNGNVYDEKVDVFSFGIILCEIIGRVSADPDFLPRRSDFGLNEGAFVDKFCLTTGCPEPFYRVAFLACHLDPDTRPPFEVLEIWLESLVMHLSLPGPLALTLLADIEQYARGATHQGHGTPECPHHDGSLFCPPTKCEQCHWEALKRCPSKGSVELAEGVLKSNSITTINPPEYLGVGCGGRALGKCVSASHIVAPPKPMGAPAMSRSHHHLHTPGYILRAEGQTINITKVDDITEWLDPPTPLKRTSPDTHLNKLSVQKTKKVESEEYHIPSFLRNQSVEGLETKSKNEVEHPLPFCRHISIPDNCEDTDSSDDESQDCYNFKDFESGMNVLAGIVKKGENLLAKKASYNVSEVMLRHPEFLNERKVPEDDCRRFNIDYLTKSPMMAEGVKNISKDLKPEKQEKGFFAKKLLSPKLNRLFKSENEKSQIDDQEKSRSKFFIQTPATPNLTRSNYRVRPALDDRKVVNTDVIESDMKLARMGKPLTPIFRRHVNEKPDFADGRFSYRDKKPKEKMEVSRRVKNLDSKQAPLVRSSQVQNIPMYGCQKDPPKKREGISRSNYVSLANLKINGKAKELAGDRERINESSPVERVI
ncbi:hypothetical protein K1T71_011510 [Dendrolimus kikuchii]|uniref:Uncharacterized protein n=1 Tax=Dendrolimus kikuchii TaxID=765133 RepID=A0ACC1CPK4_9NEOP|nr:hypothetical protein K1T71_011510 [Dendrolimus kikuchii]